MTLYSNTDKTGAFKPKHFGLFIAAQILILAVAIAAGYWFYGKFQESNEVVQKVEPVVVVADPSVATVLGRSDIAWEKKPVKIENLGFFTDVKEDWDGLNGGRETATEYFKVGRVEKGSYAGGELLMTSSVYVGMFKSFQYVFFVRKNGITYFVADLYSEESQAKKYLTPGKTLSAHITIADFETPAKITTKINGRPVTLEKMGQSPGLMDDANLLAPTSTVAFADPVWGSVYRLNKDLNQNDLFTNSSDSFVISLPLGFSSVYQFVPEIVEEKSTILINWSKLGTVIETEYSFVDFGGCGSTNYLSVVPFQVGKELVAAGVATKTNEPVYLLKDTNHELLKTSYKNYVDSMKMQQKEFMEYTDFVKTQPLFFWESPFGQMVKFTRRDTMPLTECGKPVIYLYPEQTQKVEVKIDVKGGMSYSDPAYNEGWSVVATPSSEITNAADGKTYPYLFWEGRGGMYKSPTTGWVVDREDVHTFLTTKLSAYGLNEKEIADFVEFWEPRMQQAPYYFVGFHGTEMMNRLAPLSVSPRPDSVFRILMDYKPLQKRIEAEEPTMPRTFKREGFTLVEWGGVIRGND